MATNAPDISQVRGGSISGKWIRERSSLPNLGLRVSERKLLLVILDLLMVNLSLFLTLKIRSEVEVTVAIFWDHLPWFGLVTLLWVLIGLVLNIYDLAATAALAQSLWVITIAANLTGFVYLFIPFISPALPKQRFQLLLLPAFMMISVGIWRIFYAKVIAQPIFRQRAVIVGAGVGGRMLARAIARLGEGNGSSEKASGYRLLGFVDDNVAKGEIVDGLPVLGSCKGLLQMARELRPDEIILAVGERAHTNPELCQAILDCREMGIPIITMDVLYERLMGRIPLDPAYGRLSAIFPVSQSATNRFYLVLRRGIDIVVSIIGCLLMLLLIPSIWVAHRLGSPGPLFYRQLRVGKSGRRFTLIKFRSMVDNAEGSTGPIWAAEADHRIPRVGRFLRKTRLDEVPQFWNVLCGEMSLIGPRPERPEFVSQLALQIPFYRARHAVKPGITGWAQIKYNYGASTEDARTKLQYDLYYIKHQGPYLDLLSLLRTLQVVLASKGR